MNDELDLYENSIKFSQDLIDKLKIYVEENEPIPFTAGYPDCHPWKVLYCLRRWNFFTSTKEDLERELNVMQQSINNHHIHKTLQELGIYDQLVKEFNIISSIAVLGNF